MCGADLIPTEDLVVHGDLRPHLTEHTLAAYLSGAATAEERRRIVRHLEECAACRREIADVVRLVDEPPVATTPGTTADAMPATSATDDLGAVPRPPQSRTSRRTPHRWLPAVVGTVLAAGIGAVLLARPPRAPESVERAATPWQPAAGEGERRIAVVAPREGASQSHARDFTWRGTDAERYDFTLLTESGEPLWSVETRDTTIVLPDSVSLRPGRTYFWRVDAVSGGIVLSTGVRWLVWR